MPLECSLLLWQSAALGCFCPLWNHNVEDKHFMCLRDIQDTERHTETGTRVDLGRQTGILIKL